LQNRLIQTSQTGGQRYSDTSPFSIPCPNNGTALKIVKNCWNIKIAFYLGTSQGPIYKTFYCRNLQIFVIR
jgi:hypothetical protein